MSYRDNLQPNFTMGINFVFWHPRMKSEIQIESIPQIEAGPENNSIDLKFKILVYDRIVVVNGD